MLENKLKSYVKEFNAHDSELYQNTVPNADAYEWLKERAPRFECPDESIERAYQAEFRSHRNGGSKV